MLAQLSRAAARTAPVVRRAPLRCLSAQPIDPRSFGDGLQQVHSALPDGGCLRREAPRRAHEPRRREGRYQVSRVVKLMIAFLETAQAQAQASYVAGSPVPLPPLASVLQPLASSACRQRIRAAPARNGSSQRVHSSSSDTVVQKISPCPSIARGKQHYTPQQAASCRTVRSREMH